jgi:glycine/D-amino acid oxidase-like deaminating enzyme
LILGAGLTGSCVALDLARRGIAVTLLDQDAVPVNRASLRNEGKIHLGLCYANDPTLKTAELQLTGALWFRRLLEECIGPRADELTMSTPFVYAVASDSILGVEELAVQYARIDAMYLNMLASDPDLGYLGSKPETLFSRLDSGQLTPEFNLKGLSAGFLTEELAIDPAQLAMFVREAIDLHPLITFRGRSRVSAIARDSGRYRVEVLRNGQIQHLEAAQVVNAAWDGRLAIDDMLGVLKAENWLHRLKYRVIARLPDALLKGPSVTMVVGRYGDVVVRPDGTAYLSWYPAGLQGWSHEVAPPPSWDAACRGMPDVSQARLIGERIVEAIDRWYPGVRDVDVLEIDAGAIVATGKTDVDDKSSQLHTRTAVGVWSEDGYHSVDPGKLTTAPWFARQAADRVELQHARERRTISTTAGPFHP